VKSQEEIFKNKIRKINKEPFFIKLKKYFIIKFTPKKKVISNLVNEVVNLRKQNSEFKKINYELKSLNEDLLGKQGELNKLESIDFAEVNRKVDEFNNLKNKLMDIQDTLTGFLKIQSYFSISKILNKFNLDIEDAKDNFQKIKLFKILIKKLNKISLTKEYLDQLELTNDDIKNIKKMTQIKESISENFSIDIFLDSFISKNNSKIKSIQTMLDSLLGKNIR